MEVSVLNLGSVILLLHAFSSSWDFTNRRLSILMLDFLFPTMLSQTNPNCNLGTLNGKRQLYVLPTIGIPIQSITIPRPSRDWEGFVENRRQIAWLFEHSTTGLKTSQKPCCNRMPWPEMYLSSGSNCARWHFTWRYGVQGPQTHPPIFGMWEFSAECTCPKRTYAKKCIIKYYIIRVLSRFKVNALVVSQIRDGNIIESDVWNASA